MDSMILPKRRKVSAVRDFPVAFLPQHHGQSDSHKETLGDNDVTDAFKQSDINFLTTRNNAERINDISNHDLRFNVMERVNRTSEEKVFKLVTDFLDSGAPFVTMEACNSDEEAKGSIPLAFEEHDSTENQSESIADRRTSDDVVYAQSEFSKSIKQDPARVRASSLLNHKNSCTKRVRRVSAIRDFPVAFELVGKTGQ